MKNALFVYCLSKDSIINRTLGRLIRLKTEGALKSPNAVTSFIQNSRVLDEFFPLASSLMQIENVLHESACYLDYVDVLGNN